MFAVVHAEAIPDHFRGYLSRFLQEVRTGVYVGVVTPTVVEHLWEATTTRVPTGCVTLVTSDPPSETGYRIRLHNVTTHRIANVDGIDLPVERPGSGRTLTTPDSETD